MDADEAGSNAGEVGSNACPVPISHAINNRSSTRHAVPPWVEAQAVARRSSTAEAYAVSCKERERMRVYVRVRVYVHVRVYASACTCLRTCADVHVYASAPMYSSTL